MCSDTPAVKEKPVLSLHYHCISLQKYKLLKSNYRKSYFDFVIKFENGNYLYLEVKGDDNSDIDNNKTRLLANAYSDYFQNLQTGIFKQKIIICILRVDKNTNTIIPECFYDKNQIKTDLSGVSLSKIIKTLADNV